MPKFGGVLENSGHLLMGTEIFKIEEEITEKSESTTQQFKSRIVQIKI